MTTALRSTITDLAASFASSVLDAIRQMSLDEILAETGARGGRGGKSAHVAAAKSAAAPAARAGKGGRKGRLGRRSAADIAAVVDQIASLLAANPKGLRSEQIRAKLGLQAKEMPRPLQEALDARRIAKTGEKRATTYFARTGGAAPKAAKPAKAAKRGRGKAAKKAAKKA